MAVQQLEKESLSTVGKEQLPTPPPELADEEETELEAAAAAKRASESSTTPDCCKDGDCEEHKTDAVDKSNEVDKSKDLEQSSPTKSDDAKFTKEDKKDGSSPETKDSKPDSDKKTDEKDKDETKSEDKDKKEEEKKKTLPRGMKADTKQLWAKTDANCKCCTVWSEVADDAANVEESDECLQHAIVVRKKRKHEGNRKPLKVDSIVVHSPLIKKVLHQVFLGYNDLVIDMDELIFDAPFAPFFHRWTDFEKAMNEEKDEMTKSHLKLLYDALDAELTKPLQRHKDLVRHKAIDFELLWTLFTPGTLMYSYDNGHERLYETDDCDYWEDLKGRKFSVRCKMIDYDGESMGKVTLAETINAFKGTRQITTLPSYPLKYHAKADDVMKRCIERGKRFRDLAGVECKDYKGTAIEYIQYGVKTVKNKRHLEGRIMIDEELFTKFNPDEEQDLRELGEDNEDVKKGEEETATRLAERAQKAIEALKKAEEEQKKKDEEAAKEKDEAAKKSDKADTDSKSSAADEKADEEKTDTKSQEPESTTSTVSSESKETVQKIATEDARPSNAATLTVASVDEKTDMPSSASTDCEGIPTPASETEAEEVKAKSYSNYEKTSLTDFQLAICNSWLRGYSLSHQKWCAFSVAHISDIVWNDNAFSELTLPPEYRELILATIKSQIRQNQWKQKMEKVDKEQKPLSMLSKEMGEDGDMDEENPAEFDDFIAQKGLGYIMLFSGNPGVGKTATAESIAELLHVPLCVISVGSLGTSAESVESGLQDVLELASKWSAVLLLDEADIFLEQRTTHDLHRNAVVGVFLRLLEYYQGVLCLTTNRSSDLDPAFFSRIHISLPFPDLTENNREQIWRHFAKLTNKKHEATATRRKAITEKKTESQEIPISDADATTIGTKTTNLTILSTTDSDNGIIDLSGGDFRKLSQTQLNGRQIKNAFKTAVLLASYKKEKVQMKHIKVALKTIDGNGLGKREVGGMYY